MTHELHRSYVLSEGVSAVRAPDLSEGRTPPIPRSAKIELTSRCDMRCYFCASVTRAQEQSDMEPALYRRLARELRAAGVERLGLFYIGESMLYEDLPGAIRYAKEECRFPYVFLTTNGLSATPERLRVCFEAGLDSLKFAINWSPPQFQAITGVPASELDTILANVKQARSVRDAVEFETGHRCALYSSSLRYDETQPRRMQPVLDEVLRCVDHHYWLPLLGHPDSPREPGGRPVPVKALPCGPLFAEAHVTWDGKLSACSLDASARFHVADLNTTSITEAWHSEAFQELRAHHLRHDVKGTRCRQCIAY
jgi:radical SAM protein with 4Fe4S-binding SPASM domain